MKILSAETLTISPFFVSGPQSQLSILGRYIFCDSAYGLTKRTVMSELQQSHFTRPLVTL